LLVNDVAYARETAAVDLQKVREAIVDVIESDAEKRGDGTSLYGTMIRLAWHCSGTYSQHDHSGGSAGGRMRFAPEASWGANAGLKDVAQKALEPVKAKFPELSYADLYTYAGKSKYVPYIFYSIISSRSLFQKRRRGRRRNGRTQDSLSSGTFR
jgi:catalase (peroxidase I)